ncbi:hypothetical protein BMS3Abin05_01580 [bacterium BMS3Abin05]|nr:hypothetical protein BMS3Abin05_01580 [bacterium BMS3Abin05]GBE28911.1 hypothetical protein BMS3Bbin03_02864 [bacterium BMS3Bbin03]HDK35989.1 hypothetical protein [Bacteroidota bacterium]
MPENQNERTPFVVKDCALIAIATGEKAQNLRELRDRLLVIDAGSIYYHFWAGRLRPGFDDPEYNNDFASWGRHALHDGKIAERLGAIDPKEFESLEDLRHELIEVIEERLDESEMVPWAKSDQQFNFLTSQIVVFTTKKSLEHPKDLVDAIPRMSVGSIFYHFIDAMRRTPNKTDDFREWLSGFNQKYAGLYDEIAKLDPYFQTLTQIREQLSQIFKSYFKRSSK